MGMISMGCEGTLPRREGIYDEPGIFLPSSRFNERSQITSVGARRKGMCVGLEDDWCCITQR